jgi:ubiquinone/menaquinone biosynthesis C-methylase UbiE
MATTHEPYLKAAGSDRLAPYYDLMARLGMRERYIKGRVIRIAGLAPGRRLLDLGCGTGTLVLMARRRQPEATVIGLDGDPVILAIARRKAERAGITVQLDEGMAYALPYADGAFDAVVSTLAFHHLTPEQQERTLAEVQRVLRPRGRLVIADLTLPHNRRMHLVQGVVFRLMRHLGGHGSAHQGHETMRVEHRPAPVAHIEGHAHPAAASSGDPRRMTTLEYLLTTKSWRSAAPTERYMSMIGTIAVYSLTRPGDAAADASAYTATAAAPARAPR